MEEAGIRPHRRTLTHTDHARLTRLIAEGGMALAGREDVQTTLETSAVAELGSPGLVTMNAQVFLVAGPAQEFCRITVCYPADVDPARGRISVLSPLGASLLGRCTGQTATWRSFGRVHAARIVGVLPPR
jgi:regulator of nucleoside diphosphate kinase